MGVNLEPDLCHGEAMPHRASRPALAHVLRYAGQANGARATEVPVEIAANVVYAGLPYAVMMLSPDDLEDFAIGFSLTEGVVRRASDIRRVGIEAQGTGLLIRVDLLPDVLRRHMTRRRSLHGRTSCGLCGIESIDQLPNAEIRVPDAASIAPAAIQRALAELEAHQPLNHLTHGVHAAAWCNRDGQILLAREDVGRHNALDKLIGACLRADVDAQSGFVLLTSRCSFEMVEKAAIFGVATLVAISAPTSLAIERAEALGITLVALARSDTALQFS